MNINEQIIFIAGGYGLVGSNIARLIREHFPDVRLLLAGRTPENGYDLAKKLGKTEAVKLNMESPFDFYERGKVSLVIIVMDDHKNQLREAAIEKGIDTIYISELVEEVSPIVFLSLHQNITSKLVFAGHWQGGILPNVIKHYVKEFKKVDSVNMAGVYDRKDPIGLIVQNQVNTFIANALVRKDLKWQFVDANKDPREIELYGGRRVDGLPMSVLDVPSVYALTNSPNIRFDFVLEGKSIGSSRDQIASHDLYIEISGLSKLNEKLTKKVIVSGPKGQAHMTAVGIFMIVEDLLNSQHSSKLRSGLHLPETIVSEDKILERFEKLGLEIINI